ncbi:MAG: bacteriohemerythrin [Acidobacteria bacterium]|nr:bacteriohemerythrin [Acidobacteriota bacterium]
MTWKDDYSVGVAEIDQQHRQLLDLINKLHDAMKAGGSPTALARVLEELIGYTRRHFTFEEFLMKQCGYPGLEPHRVQHRQLVEKIESFQAEVACGKATLSLRLMSFLKDWLALHILESDKQYSRDMQRSGVA